MSSMKINDRSLARAFEGVTEDQKIDKNEVNKMLTSVEDGRGMTKTEKNELEWILYKHQDNFDTEAKSKLCNALGVEEGTQIPMPTLYLRDRGLRESFTEAFADKNLSKTDIQNLIEVTSDGPGLSRTEKRELTMMLNRLPEKMDGEARKTLADFLGLPVPQIEDPTPPTPPLGPPKEVSELRGNPRELNDINTFADSFKERMDAVRNDLVGHPELSEDQKAKRMFDFFKPYGEQFHRLARDASSNTAKTEMSKMEGALKDFGFTAMLDEDSDKDGLSMAREVMKGTDPERFSMVADHEVWTTTYWPMAGSGDIDGNPRTNLWATNGALDKLDGLRRARGDEQNAKALEFERKPALNWLIGESDKGHYIPNSNLRETDAERTTGVDFDGDGRISAHVKADFLNSQGEFAAMASRNELVPKLGDEVLSRKMEEVDGQKVVNYYHADGTKVSESDRRDVVLTNPRSDGKADETMSVGWWGSCDKVALAGILFEEPKKDVTLDGVTFTKQDILGLLTVVANSQAAGTGFEGNRYDAKPDILVTNDGRQISGKLMTDDVDFQTSDMWRWDGDYMVLNGSEQDIKFKNFSTGEVETINAADIKYLAREDKKDMEASNFHHTLEKWLGVDGRPAAMDRDSGDHVWNYNFWKAERAEVSAPSNVDDLKGYKGPIKDADNLKFYETDVYFGESNYPKTYRYWIETDAAGKEINSGWMSENPDFLWRPEGFNNWSGYNSRNPYVDPQLVKEIYMKSIQ